MFSEIDKFYCCKNSGISVLGIIASLKSNAVCVMIFNENKYILFTISNNQHNVNEIAGMITRCIKHNNLNTTIFAPQTISVYSIHTTEYHKSYVILVKQILMILSSQQISTWLDDSRKVSHDVIVNLLQLKRLTKQHLLLTEYITRNYIAPNLYLKFGESKLSESNIGLLKMVYISYPNDRF